MKYKDPSKYNLKKRISRKCSESKMVEYKIQTTRLRHTGNYSCSVENKYGTCKSYAWYEIVALPLSISIPNGRPYVAEENQPEFIIPCVVQSQSKFRQFQTKWFLNDTEILPDGKIYNVSAFLYFSLVDKTTYILFEQLH